MNSAFQSVVGMSKALASSSVPASKDALLKSYQKRLKEDVTSLAANFQEIVKLCKVEEESQISRATQCEEDAFEMQVRAANMVNPHPLISTSLVLTCFCFRFELVNHS